MNRSVRATALLLACAAIGAGLATIGSAQPSEGAVVYQANIDGIITQGTATYVKQAIATAEQRGAPLVLRLETPGGLVDATLDIHKAIVRAEVPVLTFVGPSGAEAASAGTLILLMGHPAGMAPGTQIGSAQPITSSPTGGTEPAGDKVENFLVERMVQIAERTGRNTTLAARFITDNLNMGADEAREAGLIEAAAADVPAFLALMDGRDAVVGQDGHSTLATAGARIIEVQPGLQPKFLDFVGNPQVAFVLFMVGLYGLIFGLTNPGTYVPETIGALALLLAFVGFGLFSFAMAGLLLLLLAVVFFVAEAFTPSNGLLTVVGVVALLAAALLLVDEPLLPASFLRTFRNVGIATAALSGLVAGAAAWVAVSSRRRPVAASVGGTGIALSDLGPLGQVRLEGEIWEARLVAGGRVAAGEPVHVVQRDGLTLDVEPARADARGGNPEAAEAAARAADHGAEDDEHVGGRP